MVYYLPPIPTRKTRVNEFLFPFFFLFFFLVGVWEFRHYVSTYLHTYLHTYLRRQVHILLSTLYLRHAFF